MASIRVAALVLLVFAATTAAQTETGGGWPRQGGRFRLRGQGGPPFDGRGGSGQGRLDSILTQVYPNGVPAEVTNLLNQGTRDAFRQARDLVRQAAEAQGIQLPGRRRGPPGGFGPGPFLEELLARVYPNGVPAEVTNLLNQGTRDAFRQARDLVRQAAEAQGIQLPGRRRGPPGGFGPGPFLEELLARVYPNGVPAEVTNLLNQGTRDAFRQARDLVRQAAEAQGIQLPGPPSGPPGGFGPGPFLEELLARVYPNGVPAEVTNLLNQGTRDAFRQARDLVRQAAEAQGIQLPGRRRGPPGGFGPGPFLEELLARVYPNGVPAEVTTLLNQGTRDAFRQARDLVRQAAEAQGIQLPGPRPGGVLGRPGGFQAGQGLDMLVARAYPDGAPAEVRELLAQDSPQARRQVRQLARQALQAQGRQGFLGNGFGRRNQRGPFQGRSQRPSFPMGRIFRGNNNRAGNGGGFLGGILGGLRAQQQG